MIDSRRPRRSRVTRLLCLPAIVFSLVAAGCSDSNTANGDPSISADVDRGSAGQIEALTLEGKRFTPNGQVLVTMLMAASGGNTNPYVEETIQADSEGKIMVEKRPPTCPQPVDYDRGSWISVVARDMTSGISSSEVLSPGGQPDCRR